MHGMRGIPCMADVNGCFAEEGLTDSDGTSPYISLQLDNYGWEHRHWYIHCTIRTIESLIAKLNAGGVKCISI